MKRRKGRQIDNRWQLVTYKGDAQIYARCSCGFQYGVSGISIPPVVHTNWLYPYCPQCGARKKWYSDDIVKIDRLTWE